MGSRGWRGGAGNGRGGGNWNGGYSGGFQNPPDVQRQIDAANAVARTAQQNAERANREADRSARQADRERQQATQDRQQTAQALQQANQDRQQTVQALQQAAQDRQALQQALSNSAARAPSSRASSRNSLPVPNPAHMSSSSTSLTRGPTGYMIHPVVGTIPSYVPPRAQARTVTAPLAHTPTHTPSTAYAHPSLGVMQNVSVPVPVSNVFLSGSAQGLLTAVQAPQPPLAPALPPPAMSLGTGSGASSLQTVVHGGEHAMSPRPAEQSSPASTMVPG